ncbi:MAG: sodium:calcium antiporter [Phycisphaerae bacterium]|nr:sodium:calcium antiporter [Phycisphaerae bacterium]
MLLLLSASVDPLQSPTLLISLVVLVGGFALLLVGAHFLVDRATAVAHRLGISPLAIGLTVIAFGTSAPELALNVVAAASSEAGAVLAFGNVVGSNIANIGLVLALACIVHPIVAHRNIRYVYYPLLLATELLLLILASTNDKITYVDGIILLASLPVVLFVLHKAAKKSSNSDHAETVQPPKETSTTWSAIGMLALGLVMLIAGAQLAEMGAIDIARKAGLSEAVIGLTVVAVATSLPECFAAIIAARRRQFDLAMGTVIGSNLFNILSVLAITSLVRPIPIPHGVGWESLTVMYIFTLAIGVIYIKRLMGRHNVDAAGGVSLGRFWGGLILAAWISTMIWYVWAGEQASAIVAALR